MFSSAPHRLSRRQALQSASAGFGYLALAGLLGNQASAAAPAGPLAPKTPHVPTKVKRIIFLFMQGAMSQMDTMEYKSKLQASDGQVGPGGGTLTASKFKWSQHGETGTWMSELLPNIAGHVDELIHPCNPGDQRCVPFLEEHPGTPWEPSRGLTNGVESTLQVGGEVARPRFFAARTIR